MSFRLRLPANLPNCLIVCIFAIAKGIAMGSIANSLHAEQSLALRQNLALAEEIIEGTRNAEDSAVITTDNDPLLQQSHDQQAVELIAAAIAEGVPLFNSGDHQGCADRYLACAQALTALRPWHAAQTRQTLEQLSESADERAWQLRRLFDTIIADINFAPRREANLPDDFPDPGPVGVIMLKDYPTYRIAKSSGPRSFWKLFQHIKREGIPMTAPVEMSLDNNNQMMGFMYESTAQGEVGPDGKSVEVVDVAPHQVLSMTLRGRRSNANVVAAQSLIQQWAAEQQITISDEWRIYGYSSPMVSAANRYFEVQVRLLSESKENNLSF